jgi:hypothetical protein
VFKSMGRLVAWASVPAAIVFVWVWDQVLSAAVTAYAGNTVTVWIAAHAGALLLSFLLLAMAYWAGHHERSIEPTFVLESVKYSGTSTRNTEDYSLVVRNKGEPFGDNIVKLMQVRSALTGESHFAERLPMALRTQAKSEKADEGSSRFNLGANEPKQVLFCTLFHGDPGIVLVAEKNHTFSLHENDSDGFVATIGLYGRTGEEYELHVKQAGRRLKITVLDERSMKALDAKWKALRQASQQARRFPPESKDGQRPRPPSQA